MAHFFWKERADESVCREPFPSLIGRHFPWLIRLPFAASAHNEPNPQESRKQDNQTDKYWYCQSSRDRLNDRRRVVHAMAASNLEIGETDIQRCLWAAGYPGQ